MRFSAHCMLSGMVLAILASSCLAQDDKDAVIGHISAIRYEGLSSSEVMDHFLWLSDVYGPRVTGTPGFDDASEWVMRRSKEWGLKNVRQERFMFGAGWSLEKSTIRMTAPQSMQIIGYPIAWTPGTDGLMQAEAVNAVIDDPADFEKWRGKLNGKAVFIQPKRPPSQLELPLFHRLTDEELAELESDTPTGAQWRKGKALDFTSGPPTLFELSASGLYGFVEANDRNKWMDALIRFLKEENAAAVIERGPDNTVRSAVSKNWQLNTVTQRADGGVVFPPTAVNTNIENRDRLLPWLHISAEQYHRIINILAVDVPVQLELDVTAVWYPETEEGNGINTIAEIPGSDLRSEIVIVGAHLDGVHTAAGAVDNAAGAAIVMEAMRLLSILDKKPRRTVRMVLWGGEESGIIGSRAYVLKHMVRHGNSPTPSAEAKKVSAYFNIDNGAGRIRGVFARENLAAVPVLKKWIEPLADLGVVAVSSRATTSAISNGMFSSGSDHMYFDAIGIPAFELIQDPLDYYSRSAHSNMDYSDRAPAADMIQASVVLASLVYQAAMADERMPRRPVFISPNSESVDD